MSTLLGPPHPAALDLMRELHPHWFEGESWDQVWDRAWATLTPDQMRTLIEGSTVDPEDHDYQGDGTSRCCVCLGSMNDHVSWETCRSVEVDGETIRVLGGEQMSAESQAAFADLVRAAKRRTAAESCRCTGITSQTGVDQNFGPDKVWRCDECGRIANIGESL
jgi:hypothetical protein